MGLTGDVREAPEEKPHFALSPPNILDIHDGLAKSKRNIRKNGPGRGGVDLNPDTSTRCDFRKNSAGRSCGRYQGLRNAEARQRRVIAPVRKSPGIRKRHARGRRQPSRKTRRGLPSFRYGKSTRMPSAGPDYSVFALFPPLRCLVPLSLRRVLGEIATLGHQEHYGHRRQIYE